LLKSTSVKEEKNYKSYINLLKRP